jgi:hypothetical protein
MLSLYIVQLAALNRLGGTHDRVPALQVKEPRVSLLRHQKRDRWCRVPGLVCPPGALLTVHVTPGSVGSVGQGGSPLPAATDVVRTA